MKRKTIRKRIADKNRSAKTAKKRRPKKLSHKESIEIVKRAINSFQQGHLAGTTIALRHVFPSYKDRQLFRQNVSRIVVSRGFKIDLNKIPIQPHHTFHQISRALTISALPGDSTTLDPT
jgi:hypothetical protein